MNLPIAVTYFMGLSPDSVRGQDEWLCVCGCGYKSPRAQDKDSLVGIFLSSSSWESWNCHDITTAVKATGARISIAPVGDPQQYRLAPACCCCFLWLRGLTFSSRDHGPNITLPVGGYFSFYYFCLERGHDDFSNWPAFEEMLGSGYPGWVWDISVSYIQ